MHRTWAHGLALSGLLATALTAPATAQAAGEKIDLAMAQRIRDEGMNRSQLPTLSTQLFDQVGQRLTASSSLRAAQQWAAKTMTTWGFQKVVVEPWDSLFGRGWERVSYSGRWIEPLVQPLYAMPLAWTGSTKNMVTCSAMVVTMRDSTDYAKYNGKLKGQCVLLFRPFGADAPDGPPQIRWEFGAPAATRYSPDSLMAWSVEPMPERGGRGGRGRGAGNGITADSLANWFKHQAPAAILTSSSRTYGLLQGSAGLQSRFARDSNNFEPLPALVISHEQAGQMFRDLQNNVPVKLEINVQNKFVNPDKKEFNVVGEIPGTDRATEVVMVGAHFDSWYGGTGATDNGAGSVVMMEALRILKTLNAPLRRTVKIGLWSGEEQGLLGSRDWVRKHSAEMDSISAYLNVDNGSGRLRGVYAQGNMAAIPVFEQIMLPFRDVGVVASRISNTGGTDHLSFDAVGVPGFQFIQDPLDYDTRTHHSQVDTYERLQMDDLKQAAVIVAFSVYTIANRDQMMPRKPPRNPGTN
jgi:hypothetical protein